MEISILAGRPSQKLKLAAQFIQHSNEPCGRRAISNFDFAYRAESFHDHIDRSILHVQAASIGKHPDLCSAVHFRFFSEASGQGLSGRAASRRRLSSSRLIEVIELSGRT